MSWERSRNSSEGICGSIWRASTMTTRNVQVNRYEKGILLIYNGAAAQVIGFEAEGEARPQPAVFALNFGLSVLNDKYTSFPNADITSPRAGRRDPPLRAALQRGNRLTATPDWTFDLSGTYNVSAEGRSARVERQLLS